MKYSKIEDLRISNKISIRKMARELEMSDSGYSRMIENETCSVSVLERIANYFKLPITYFFDEKELKVYAENSSHLLVEDSAGPDYFTLKERNQILESKLSETSEKLLEAKDTIIKLLSGNFNNEILTDNEPEQNGKRNKTRVKGFRGMNSAQFQLLITKMITDANQR